MNILAMFSKSFQLLRRDGLFKSIAHAARKLTDRHPERFDEFDAAHGTDTAGHIPLWKLRIKSPNAKYGIQYQPTWGGVVAKSVAAIGVDPREFTFIDLGCGKGRTLIQACEIGFPSVVGVEFSAELVSVAAHNLAKLNIPSSRASAIFCDAAEFQFPDRQCVVYLFNPFSAEVLRKVAENIVRRATSGFLIYFGFDSQSAELLDSFFPRSGDISSLDQSGNAAVWKIR